MVGVDVESEGAEASEPPSHATGGGIARWALDPVVVALVLAAVCLPVATAVPQSDLDSSWRLAMSLVHQRGIDAGSGFVFTYGPLGFLSAPNLVWLPGGLLGVVYAAVSAFALYWLVVRGLRRWLPPLWAVVVTACFAVLAAHSLAVAEMATMAVVLWCLELVHPDRLRTALAQWVPVALGAAAAVQLLVKFSAGGVALAVATVACVARPPRPARVLALAGSFVASLVVLWLALGESLADLPDWLRRSLDMTLGYAAGMGLPIDADREHPLRYWPWAVLVFAFAAFGLWLFARRYRARSAAFVVAFVGAAWALLKLGFVRVDPGHAAITLLGVAALLTALEWRPGLRAVGIAGVALALVGTAVSVGEGEQVRSHVADIVTGIPTGVVNTARVLRGTVQPSYREELLDNARHRIRRKLDVPRDVVEALRGEQVHASPTDVSALWAYGLDWKPVPVFQQYAAYTDALDELNASSLVEGDGPSGVLHTRFGVDFRIPEWESPRFMTELVCNFGVLAADRRWEALRRSRNRCGRPEVLAQVTARPGEAIEVPAPRSDDSIVTASFDVPVSAKERVATALLKPISFPAADVNGTWHRFDLGTDGQPHLVHVPAEVDGRALPSGGFDLDAVSFPNAGGDVTATFYEIPVHRANGRAEATR